VVPTFTTNRLTGLVLSSSPAASPRVRRRLSRWPPRRPRKSDFGVAVPASGLACAAARPISTWLELFHALRGFSHWFTCVTPFRLACRTRVVWRCRPVPSLSGLLPTLTCSSRVRLPSASLACCDRLVVESFHLHPVIWRLVAHSVVHEKVPAGGQMRSPLLATKVPAGGQQSPHPSLTHPRRLSSGR